MKYYLFAIFILGSLQSNALNWPKEVVNTFKSKMTVKIEFTDSETLIFSVKKTQLQVSRTFKPTVFSVNYRKIDILDYNSKESLISAIKLLLPGATSKFQIFVQFAYADDALDKEAAQAIAELMLASIQNDSCEAYFNFANKCLTEVDKILASSDAWEADAESRQKNITKKAKAVKSNNPASYNLQIFELNKKLVTLNKQINENIVPLIGTGPEQIGRCGCEKNESTVNKCQPSNSNGDVHPKMRACLDSFKLLLEITSDEIKINGITTISNVQLPGIAKQTSEIRNTKPGTR